MERSKQIMRTRSRLIAYIQVLSRATYLLGRYVAIYFPNLKIFLSLKHTHSIDNMDALDYFAFYYVTFGS